MRASIYTTLPTKILSFLGNFNGGMESIALKDFCNIYSLTSLVNKPNYYENPLNPSCIDSILTNSPKHFQNFNLFETGLSDFHKMVVAVMKTSYLTLEPKK